MTNLKLPKITVGTTVARLITSALAAWVFGRTIPLTATQFAELFIVIWVWLFIYGYVVVLVEPLVEKILKALGVNGK